MKTRVAKTTFTPLSCYESPKVLASLSSAISCYDIRPICVVFRVHGLVVGVGVQKRARTAAC